MTERAPRSPFSRCALGIFAVLSLSWLLACEQPVEEFPGIASENQPPNTHITATPPTLQRTDFLVSFNWLGEDNDGEVVGFEWRISDNGEDGVIGVQDTLEALLPWHFTTATDSTFWVRADQDSFPPDLLDPNLDPRQIRYWRSHTFWVRSIDNEGRRDPTPANASFTSTTLAPIALVNVPKLIPNVTCVSSARVLTFGWSAIDGDGYRNRAAATRYLLLPDPRGDGSCYTKIYFELEQPITGNEPGWSPWIPYDPDDPTTHTITYPVANSGVPFLFAVQALDEAGAVTPTFEWDRNVRHVLTTDFKLPGLIMREPILGSYSFVGTNQIRRFDVINDQPLQVSWEGDAAAYAGTIVGYRWGWDVQDPDDSQDPNWAVPWGLTPNHFRTDVTRFERGLHYLVVRARDNSGSEVQGVFQINIIPLPSRDEQRPLLIVDDFPNGNTPEEEYLDKVWNDRLIQLAEGSLVGFSGGDFISADDHRGRLKFQTLVDYRSILWFLGPSTLSYWYSAFATGGEPVHYVEAYQQRVGNIMLVGPGAAYSTSRHNFGFFQFPQQFLNNAGLYPWRSLCLELVDIIRPAPGGIIGETAGTPVRTLECDGIYAAKVHPKFLEVYPDAEGELRDLGPLGPRIEQDRTWSFHFEEFYNANVTGRRLPYSLRDCQVPMFGLVARRESGLIDNPELDCRPAFAEESRLEGVPIAMAIKSYADQKPLRGAEDFIWGFNPAAFRLSDVKNAFLYIAQRRWGMTVVD